MINSFSDSGGGGGITDGDGESMGGELPEKVGVVGFVKAAVKRKLFEAPYSAHDLRPDAFFLEPAVYLDGHL